MKCYIPMWTPTEVDVNSIPQFNLTFPDGTWDPSSRKFEVSKPYQFNFNLSQYYDSNPNRDLYSIHSHPLVEDEFLSPINAAFDSQALISALECNVLVRTQVIGGKRVASLSSTTRKCLITLQVLSKYYGIGLKTAAYTLRATTKMGYRSQQGKIFHRYRT